MEIEYDPGKNIRNQRKHAIPLSLVEAFEWDTARIISLHRAEQREYRRYADA